MGESHRAAGGLASPLQAPTFQAVAPSNREEKRSPSIRGGDVLVPWRMKRASAAAASASSLFRPATDRARAAPAPPHRECRRRDESCHRRDRKPLAAAVMASSGAAARQRRQQQREQSTQCSLSSPRLQRIADFAQQQNFFGRRRRGFGGGLGATSLFIWRISRNSTKATIRKLMIALTNRP